MAGMLRGAIFGAGRMVLTRPMVKPTILHCSRSILQSGSFHTVTSNSTLQPMQIILTRLRSIQWSIRMKFEPKRNYSQAKRDKLPFETDGKVRRDTLIFSYKNDRLYKYMTVFGFVQFAFWGNLAWFMATAGRTLTADESKFKMNSVYGRVIRFFKEHSIKVSGALIALGLLVMASAIVYPYRTVSRITLLKGGKNVCVRTYANFGFSREFDIELEKICCKQGRTSAGSTLAMKIKGHPLYYQLDKRDGIFHHQDLFDYVIGIQRKL